MRYPKMILFDYGHTLIHETDSSALCGTQALMPYVTENPEHYSPEEICAVSDRLSSEIMLPVRASGLDIHNLNFQRLLYEYLEIKFSCTPEEIEEIFIDHAFPAEPMPGAQEMISELNRRGIRTGVISNTSFSGSVLHARLNRLLPENRFEFIMTSSEYIYRKPSKLLFALALKKAHLCASDVWFCGDDVEADVMGAAGVGIYPVWYDNPLACTYRSQAHSLPQGMDCFHIHDWAELTARLEYLQKTE